MRILMNVLVVVPLLSSAKLRARGVGLAVLGQKSVTNRSVAMPFVRGALFCAGVLVPQSSVKLSTAAGLGVAHRQLRGHLARHRHQPAAAVPWNAAPATQQRQQPHMLCALQMRGP